MAVHSQIHIGCAGWNIPRDQRDQFPPEGSHLQRYASRFPCVEINSSFYRPHRSQTYERWAEDTPEGFRFSVKFPRLITHEQRLQDIREPLLAFLDQSSHLGVKLGCYLIQLPPSLKFDPGHTANFLREFREISNVPAVCEPRHVSWSSQHASDILSSFQVGLVQADPSPVPQLKDVSAGDVVYLRLHGSPRIYYSNYDDRQLEEISDRIRSYHTKGHEVWCIFDNTALGAATINALQLQSSLNNTSDSAVS